MAKEKKQPRPKAENPKGFRDYFGAEVSERAAMLETIARVYHLYGFDALESPAVETLEALGKYLPDVDRPHAGVFAWAEDEEGGKGDWLALRYDLTAPLARVYAQHRQELPTPYRRYAMGPVWRNEKPGPGRYRQFYQCDADTVGAASVAADADICAMLADTLEAVGIPRGDYVVRVNNRKVLNGVLEVAGLHDDEEHSHARGIVLRAIDKLDRLGVNGVRDLLGAGRKDESGDFTEGAKLSNAQIAVIMRFVGASTAIDQRLRDQAQTAANRDSDMTADLSNAYASGFTELFGRSPGAAALRNVATLNYLSEIVEGSSVGVEGVAELKKMAELLAAQGYEPNQITIDSSVVRGLGYYTGPVYEAELTFDIVDEDGRKRQFGSVAGGGRYDDLVKRFTGQLTPATGVSIGVDRLLAALRAIGRAEAEAAGPVVVCVMDRARMADYQRMVAELRGAGIRAEAFLGGGNMAKQLKYADRRAAPVAVIAGEDEFAKDVVQLKDLALGARLAANIETHEEWKAQPAQVEAPRAGLVEAVRAMLARAG